MILMVPWLHLLSGLNSAIDGIQIMSDLAEFVPAGGGYSFIICRCERPWVAFVNTLRATIRPIITVLDSSTFCKYLNWDW